MRIRTILNIRGLFMNKLILSLFWGAAVFNGSVLAEDNSSLVNMNRDFMSYPQPNSSNDTENYSRPPHPCPCQNVTFNQDNQEKENSNNPPLPSDSLNNPTDNSQPPRPPKDLNGNSFDNGRPPIPSGQPPEFQPGEQSGMNQGMMSPVPENFSPIPPEHR